MPTLSKLLQLSAALVAVAVLGIPQAASASGDSATPAPSAPSGPSAALAADSGPWEINPYATYWASGNCVETAGQATTDGAQIQLWTCGEPTPNHRRWYMNNYTGNYWRIYSANAHSMCWTSQGHSTASGTKIVQETCDGDTSQQFTLRRIYDGSQDFYWFEQRSSGKCVRLQSATVANGTDLVLGVCDTDSNYFPTYFTSFTWHTAN